VEITTAVALYCAVPMFIFARVGERFQENLTFELTELERFTYEV
jgi:hypothetical protein